MGEKTQRSLREDHTRRGEPVLLQAVDVRLRPNAADAINLGVRPGEIVALAGPVGGGKETLAMMLAGQVRPASGKIVGRNDILPVIGLVPTDRHASGYIAMLGVRENVAIGGLEELSDAFGFGFIDQRKEFAQIAKLAQQTNVIASSLEQPVGQLSGGNQQKVVFARALCRDPEVVVALSPTRGVDVGAKEQLYALLRRLAAEGLGVIVVSDEEDEIDQLANRVVIVFGDKIIDELVGDYTMKDLILRMEGVV